MAKAKSSDERRLLQLQGRELTIRGKKADLEDEHLKVRQEIVNLKNRKAKKL